MISRHWLTVETEGDDKVLQLITGTNDYIASIDGYIQSVVIDFDGERLPSLDPSTITSDITFTATHDFDSDERQFVRLTFDASVNAATITFDFAGEHYVCHIYRGATIEGIAYGPNTPVQPPMSETWTGSTSSRTYLLVQKAGEIVINRNWEIPPQIASTEVFITEDGSNYAARINPVANPPAGNYVIKYCNQPLINVTVN